MNIIVKSNGKLSYLGKEYKCALGRSGVGEDKQEGDGKTPVGSFPIRYIFYRVDRMPTIPTSIVTKQILKDDAWSDDVSDPENYNKHVKLPYKGSHEELWRDDHLYDIVVVLGYNDEPVVPGKGSAIFMHVARSGYSPTDGCIALSRDDLIEVLSLVQPDTQVVVEK